MLIPSIDLQGGRIVQLVQGEKLIIETSDIDAWIRRLTGQPKVQLIDLDAAKGVGDNADLVARICHELPCRVGGGIRSIERAREVLGLGATNVIAGSALFTERGVDVDFAAQLSEAVGLERLIAAVDTRGGRVVIHGWRTQVPCGPVEAMQALDPFVSEFLFTNVDREGLMQGTDLHAIEEIRQATTRRVTAAGGITTMEEVKALDAMKVDAVVGMALYTGRITLGAS
ncbi:MAG TPA: HisA/HisF-related TIM barrel protein [Vicinamibacterales bacterium]|jgi:phosphoribosylformimino-5-aminoimidazole carboxamide ribotide isomerase|nr:HisA/HisF-related TIM barrel protein [Vicinamibacterales bacterium]